MPKMISFKYSYCNFRETLERESFENNSVPRSFARGETPVALNIDPFAD